MTETGLLIGLAIAVVAVVLLFGIISQRSQVTPVSRDELRAAQADWRPPGELQSHSIPRNVRFTSRGLMTMVLFIAISSALVVVGGFLIPAMRRTQLDTALVAREGIAATATITQHWATHGKSVSYHVTYAYDIDGHRYSASAKMSRGVFDRVDVGVPTAIHYAPSSPNVSRMDDATYDSPWIGLVIFVPALLLLVMPIRIMQMKNLLMYGTPAGAIVTSCARTKGGRALRYQFLDPSGEVVTRREVVSSLVADQPGTVIAVLFDPNRPSRAARYPIGMVRLDN